MKFVQRIRTLFVISIVFISLLLSNITMAQSYEAGDVIQDEFGFELVYVPGGTYTMGISQEHLRQLCDQRGETNPNRCAEIIQDDTGATYQETVEIQPYWIDRFEVTIEQFQRLCGMNINTTLDDCIDNTFDEGLTLSPNQPQVGISWYTANFLCNQRNARLPTEAEWEFAASGFENSVFAWGDTFNSNLIHYPDPQFTKTYPIGSISENVSWVGAFDMTGNVEEWVEDRFAVRVLSNIEPQDWPSPSIINALEISRMTKGGFWNSSFWNLTNFYRRQATSPEVISPNIGFRCVRSLLDD